MYTYIGAVVLPTGSFHGSLPIVLSDVACVGHETYILNCSGNINAPECDSGEGAAIVCQGERHVFSLIMYITNTVHH